MIDQTTTRVRRDPARVAAPVGTPTGRDSLQDALLVTYQHELAAAGGELSHVSAVGARALEALLDELNGLLWWRAGEQLSFRFAGQVREDILEECVAEARLACIVSAGAYDATQNKSFRGWVTGEAGGSVTVAIARTIQAATGTDVLTQGERIALSYLYSARATLQEHGGEPSVDEIRARATASCVQWALDRVAAAEQAEPPGTDEKTDAIPALEAAMNKLRRNGVLHALAGDVLALLTVASPVTSFEAAAVDERVAPGGDAFDPCGDAVVSAGMSDLGKVAVCGMAPGDQVLVWEHLLDQAGPPRCTSGPGAALSRASRARVAALLGDAQGRLGAPHAQFAALSPTLGLQFEDAAQRATSPGATALSAALRSAAGSS